LKGKLFDFSLPNEEKEENRLLKVFKKTLSEKMGVYQESKHYK
jgi:hypothetical protein